MTPSEDVDLIRRFYESWSNGDMEASLECLHPDVEIEATGAVLWAVREGRITGAKLFQTTEAAVEGAGRST